MPHVDTELHPRETIARGMPVFGSQIVCILLLLSQYACEDVFGNAEQFWVRHVRVRSDTVRLEVLETGSSHLVRRVIRVSQIPPARPGFEDSLPYLVRIVRGEDRSSNVRLEEGIQCCDTNADGGWHVDRCIVGGRVGFGEPYWVQ